MATIDELADRLQQFFAAKFPPGHGDGPGTVLLVFDPLGTPLSPDEYIGSGTDAAKDILAHQAAARLADQLPAANLLAAGWFLPRAGSRLSNWYQQVISASAPVATDDASIRAFELLKAAATSDLRQNRLVLASGTVIGGGGTVDAPGTHDHYLATSMTPVDWYEPDATCWQHYDLHSADPPPSTAPAPTVFHRPRFDFRVATDAESPALTEFVAHAVRSGLAIDPPPNNDVVRPISDAAVLERPALRLFQLQRPLSIAASTVPDDGALVGRLNESSSILVERATISTVEPMVLSSSVSTNAIHTHLDEIAVSNLAVEPALIHDATTPQAPTSENFEVTFDYCMVRFDRSWWAEVMLLSRGWKVPGFAPGDMASGTASAPTGPVTLITIGTLVVKNLKISAQWSDADKTALAGSTSLGPFCIAGAHYDTTSGEISRPGAQAIAWLCQVPPQLPPTPI